MAALATRIWGIHGLDTHPSVLLLNQFGKLLLRHSYAGVFLSKCDPFIYPLLHGWTSLNLNLVVKHKCKVPEQIALFCCTQPIFSDLSMCLYGLPKNSSKMGQLCLSWWSGLLRLWMEWEADSRLEMPIQTRLHSIL